MRKDFQMPLSLARGRWISAIMETTDKAEVEIIIEVAQAIIKVEAAAEAVVDRTIIITTTMIKAGEAILVAAQAIMDMTGEIVLTIPILEISNQIECSQEQDLVHGRMRTDTDRIKIIIKIIIITVKNQMKITITQMTRIALCCDLDPLDPQLARLEKLRNLDGKLKVTTSMC